MKRRLGYLLTVILAMTMVMGIGVTALALENIWNQSSYDSGVVDLVTDESDVINLCGFYNYSGQNAVITARIYFNDIFFEGPDTYPDGTGITLANRWIYGQSLINRVLPSLAPDKSSDDFERKMRITWDGTNKIMSYYFSYNSSTPEPCGTAAHTHNFQWQTITEPTQYSDGLAGDVCTICGLAKNTQPLSAYGFTINDYATKMVNASKSGQVIKLELGEWNSFPKAFMEKVAAKSAQNVTFVFKYKWNHVKQEITIPAGTLVDTSLDWYGPAKMAELYGAN